MSVDIWPEVQSSIVWPDAVVMLRPWVEVMIEGWKDVP